MNCGLTPLEARRANGASVVAFGDLLLTGLTPPFI